MSMLNEILEVIAKYNPPPQVLDHVLEMLKSRKVTFNTKACWGACPECGGTMEHGEGCPKCRDCGYSTCG